MPAAPIFTILSAHLSPLSVSLHSEKVCGKKSISWVGPSTISGSWPNLIIDLFANLIANSNSCRELVREVKFEGSSAAGVEGK